MIPAHKRLRTGQHRLVGAHVIFWLIINQELIFAYGCVEILNQLLRVQFAADQFIVIVGNGAGEAALHQIRRPLGAVKAALRVKCLVDTGIDAHAEPDAVVRLLLPRDLRRNLLEHLLVILTVRAVNQESIRLSSAHNAAGGAENRAGVFADPAQNLIAVDASVALIDQMEVIHVDEHRIHFLSPVQLIQLFRIPEEEFTVVEAGELIALGGLDGLAVLGELNGPQDAGLHDGGGRIGLGNKVGGAHLQTLHLGVRICRQDNDRDPGENGVAAHFGEHFHTGHHRHEDIQQDQGNLLSPAV